MQTIQEALVEMQLDSGEIVLIRRLSPFARQALLNRAEEIHPNPEKKLFERPLSDTVPNAMPGVMAAAEDNPDYKAALQTAKIAQMKWFNDTVIQSGVVVDSKEGREQTIERYMPRLQSLRELLSLPDNPWLATVLYGLITTKDDRIRIVKAAIETLTEEDIRLAMRSFRSEV